MYFRILNGLYFLFVATLSATVALSFFDASSVLITILSLTSLLLLVLISKQWFDTVHLLARQSDQLLIQNSERNKWSFSNLFQLKNNHELIGKKFETTTSLITNLAHAEPTKIEHELNENDPIAKAIKGMKAEMQKIKTEEDERNWVTQSLTKFNELLRKKTELKEYGNTIISGLAKYLNISQGNFYIERQDEHGERFLELVACYAIAGSKLKEDRIEPGNGLLGQCMVDKDFVYITDVPRNYVKITSGLGQAAPRNIIIAPLIFNEIFCGVIEMASFDIFQSQHKEFLEKVCSDIAAEIVSLKNSEHTKKLLQESNSLAQELRLRQAELKSYLRGVNNTIASVEFNLNGMFIEGNEIFLKVMGFHKEELLKKSFDDLMGSDLTVIMMWENLRLGKHFSGEFKMKDKKGNELWLTGTFNPITVEGDVPQKIIMLAQFTTQEKEKLNDLTTVVHALKATLPVLEFNPDFSCKAANEKAMKFFSLSRLSLKSKTVLDFIEPSYRAAWSKKKDDLLNREFTSVHLPFISGDANINFEVTVSVVKNLNGSVARIIMLLVREVNSPISVLAEI